jgi:hypothetical protein
MTRFRSICLAAFALVPVPAIAHHGQDFLLLESPTVPHPGNVYIIANAHLALSGDAEERAGFEPALFAGISPRIAFEVHAHAEKLKGQNWDYEATAPAIHVLLTDPARHEGFKAGISAEYEIAAANGSRDNVEVRLSLEDGTEENKWAGNLIASREQGGNSDFGVALGFRHEVRPGVALGMEGQSSFQHVEGAQLLAGMYLELDESRTIKFAIGSFRDKQSEIQPVAHVGLVLRMR